MFTRVAAGSHPPALRTGDGLIATNLLASHRNKRGRGLFTTQAPADASPAGIRPGRDAPEPYRSGNEPGNPLRRPR